MLNYRYGVECIINVNIKIIQPVKLGDGGQQKKGQYSFLQWTVKII